MARSRTLWTSFAALLLMASCTPASPEAPLPDLLDTTAGVMGIVVGGGSDGPVTWGTYPDIDAFYVAYGEFKDYALGGARPHWAPSGTIAVGWAVSCRYGIDEAWSVADGLGDAWDGSFVYVGADVLDFDPGTLRVYADGTITLSCAALGTPTGVEVTRHLIVPGAGLQGRFAVEVIDLVGTAQPGVDLAGIRYYLDDGSDDDPPAPWATYGSLGPFAWATKDDSAGADPAIGLIPLLSPQFAVDTVATGGDEYDVAAKDGAQLAAGEHAVVAIVAGIRGGFAVDDAAGKDAAMQALGQELATLDGDAVCRVGSSGPHVWAKLVEGGGALLEAICAGYEAL